MIQAQRLQAMLSAQETPRALPPWSPRALGRVAICSLWQELALYPKPGLVSLNDNGAHDNMSAATFVRSLFALRPYYAAIAQAGARDATLAELQALGIAAERAMLGATGGINTHRGAIFVLGFLCAAAARALASELAPSDAVLRSIVKDAWTAALPLDGRAGAPSHGDLVRVHYGAGGARAEARAAFPSVFDIGLPALRGALRCGHDARLARLSAFFALLAAVEDTNVLYRGGTAGLRHVQRAARAFRTGGDVEHPQALRRAVGIHEDFVARRFSPGGCADLLAATLFVHALQCAWP